MVIDCRMILRKRRGVKGRVSDICSPAGLGGLFY